MPPRLSPGLSGLLKPASIHRFEWLRRADPLLSLVSLVGGS
ncbi:hypothetical protein ACFFX0_31155 [Citricoccus parietis]|uniref:Uncharacterized protein n=1 Tax=Citricoccus parietis TaxID=592307 RepID=A0ABV5G8W0_9MICC